MKWRVLRAWAAHPLARQSEVPLCSGGIGRACHNKRQWSAAASGTIWLLGGTGSLIVSAQMALPIELSDVFCLCLIGTILFLTFRRLVTEPWPDRVLLHVWEFRDLSDYNLQFSKRTVGAKLY